jgi:hypothetical protein
MTIHTATNKLQKKLQIAISGQIFKCEASQLCNQNATIKMHNFVENDIHYIP